MVVIIAVELLGKVVGICRNHRWRELLTCGADYCWVLREGLDKFNLLAEKLCRSVTLSADARIVGLTLYRADTSVCVLDEWTCVTVVVDALTWVEEHSLLRVNFEDEIFQCAKTHHLRDGISLLLRATIEFA